MRSLVAQHLNAVRRYLELGDDQPLRGFKGLTVIADDDRELEVAADRATIDRLAEGAEIWIDLYWS